MIYEESIFKEFITDRNIKQDTARVYYKALKRYSELHKMRLQELFDEADDEEEQMIRPKRRTIIKRLKQYRQYLIDNGYAVSTVEAYFTHIKTFYKHFQIEIPNIPPVNLQKNNHERYSDIPKIKNIKEAIEATNNLRYKAIILFMASSGTAINETTHLTIQDFINATSDYHNSSDIYAILEELKKQDDIIPLFDIIRMKTNFPYYTCCSPEATTAIIKYLKTRNNLQKDDLLFEVKKDTVIKFLQRLNDKLGYGTVKYYRFLHSHSFRKFHATAIEDIGLANTLQGRKADPITEAYFKHNPQRIKEKYLEHLPKLTINKTEINILNDEGSKKLRKVEAELAEMKQNKEQEREEIISDVLKIIQNNPDFLKDRLSKIDDL